MKELGKKIRARRLRLKVSLRKLATTVGKSHGWLLLLEQGQIQQPRSEDLTAIADALGEDPQVYLSLAGRVNLAAAHIVPATENVPEWARRLEAKIDSLSDSLALTKADVDGSAKGLAELLGLVRQGQTPSEMQGERVARRRAVRRQPAPQASVRAK